PAAAVGAGAVAAVGAGAGVAVFGTPPSWQPAKRAQLPDTHSHTASARGANRPIMSWSLPLFKVCRIASATPPRRERRAVDTTPVIPKDQPSIMPTRPLGSACPLAARGPRITVVGTYAFGRGCVPEIQGCAATVRGRGSADARHTLRPHPPDA